MEFTWKRFGAFMLLGILVAAANIGLMMVVEGHRLWNFYILIGGMGGFFGTAAGMMDFMSSNFGRGISRSYIDDWGFEHALAPIPSPRRSGFLMGFAAFHMVPFAVLVGMSFFR